MRIEKIICDICKEECNKLTWDMFEALGQNFEGHIDCCDELKRRLIGDLPVFQQTGDKCVEGFLKTVMKDNKEKSEAAEEQKRQQDEKYQYYINSAIENSKRICGTPEEVATEEQKPKKAGKAKKAPEAAVLPPVEGPMTHERVADAIKTAGLDMRRADEAAQVEKVIAAHAGISYPSAEACGLAFLAALADFPIVFDPELSHHKDLLKAALEKRGVDFSTEEGRSLATQTKADLVMRHVFLCDVEKYLENFEVPPFDAGF
jgi:hypothetical protein